MAWTPKTLIPRLSSNCTVVYSQVLRGGEIGEVAFIHQILSLFYFVTLLSTADTNGDGYFDEQEMEALFTKEVKMLHPRVGNR